MRVPAVCAALADDAYFAICQPGAHRHARECLHVLQPAAARAAAAAAKVERAARGARGLVERGLSLASSPADALATADPAALDARRRELATCLPALLLEGEPTLHPRLLQLLVSLCAASGAATHAAATQPLLLGCLAHPWPAVRETLLAQLLAALSRADAAGRGSRGGDVEEEDSDFSAAEAEAREAGASDDRCHLAYHLRRPATLALLVRLALHADAPPAAEAEDAAAAAASASRLAQLAHAVLMHCLPRLSDAEVAAFAPLLPVLQAGLLNPLPHGAHGEEEDREEHQVLPSEAEASFHARKLLAAVLPRLPPSTRLAAALRLLLHAAEPLAAHATAQLIAMLGWADELASAPPPAALHPHLLPAPAAGVWRPDASGGRARVHGSFDALEMSRLLAVLANELLEPRIRAAGAQQLATLCADAALRAHALRTGLLPLLLGCLQECLRPRVPEGDDGEEAGEEAVEAAAAAVAPLGASCVGLLGAIVHGCDAAREAVLSSLPALQLLAAASLHADGALRLAVRETLAALLFDPATLAAAAAADDSDDPGGGWELPERVLARCSEPEADPTSAAAPLALRVVAAFALELPRPASAAATVDAAGTEPAGWGAAEAAAAIRRLCGGGSGGGGGALAATLRSRKALRDALQDGGAEGLDACTEGLYAPVADEVARARRLEPRAAMEAELAALDACTNHDDCAACIERLEAACTAHALLQALHAPRAAPTAHPLLALLRVRATRAAPAAGALFRLLSVPPVTEADDALLARLLVLLERALRDDLASEGAASAPSTSGSLVSPSTGTLFAPADVLPGRLLAALVGSGCAVLDLSKEPRPPLAHGELPPARNAVRQAVLRFGVALLQRYPHLGRAALLGGGDGGGALLPLLCEQYAATAGGAVAYGAPSAVPAPLRRAALHLAYCLLRPERSDGSCCDAAPDAPPVAPAAAAAAAAAANASEAAAAVRTIGLVPALLPATVATHGVRALQGAASRRLALGCLHGALQLASPHRAAMARFWEHGARWLLPLLGAADARTRATAFDIAATLAAAEGSEELFAHHVPELLSAAARAAFAAAEDDAEGGGGDAGAACCVPRAAALRLLAAVCDAAAVRVEGGSVAFAVGGAAEGAELWEALQRQRAPQRALALLAEAAPSADAVAAACALLGALLRLRAAAAPTAALLGEERALASLRRWLDAREYWLAYSHAQAAGGRARGRADADAVPGDGCSAHFGAAAAASAAAAAAASGSTPPPLSRLQGAEWLARALPRVQLARAATLRVLRALLLSGSVTTKADGSVRPLSGAAALLASSARLLPSLLPLLADPLAAPPEPAANPASAFSADGGWEALPATPPENPPPEVWRALRALLRGAAHARPRAVVEAATFEMRYEAMALWREVLRRVPATRAYLLGAQLRLPSASPAAAARAVPWALTLTRCLRSEAPRAVRLEACRLMCALCDGAEAVNGGAPLDTPVEAEATAAGEASPEADIREGEELAADKDEGEGEASNHAEGEGAGDDDADGGAPAGDTLALALLRLHAERTPADHAAPLPLVLDAMRGLVALSRAAKLRVLRDGFLPQLLQRLDDLRAGGAAAAAAAAAAATAAKRAATGACAAEAAATATAAAARRTEAAAQLRGSLALLANLLHGCAEAKLACVALRLPLLLLRLWPLSAGAGFATLREALLRTLANYVAHCAPAKCSLTAYSDAKGRCLVALLCRLVTRDGSSRGCRGAPPAAPENTLPITQWRLCWATLQSLSTGTESRSVLLRAQLLPRAIPALRRALHPPAAAVAEADTAAAHDARAAAVLDFAANLSFAPEGQATLLRAPEAFDVLLEALEGRLAASRRAAALCLRNLAFCADGKVGASLLPPPTPLPPPPHPRIPTCYTLPPPPLHSPPPFGIPGVPARQAARATRAAARAGRRGL